jgi:hypothetical protein
MDGNAVTAIAFVTGTRIFVATSNGVWRFDQAAGVWSQTAITAPGLPTNRYITDIDADTASAGSFYAALGAGPISHVWYFDGAAWHDAALPLNSPCSAIVVDPANPNIVYVGADVGCWKGTKTGPATWTWVLFSQGLPEAAITDLAIHARTRLLRAATHGRGVWEIPIDAMSGQDPDIYLRVNYADTGRVTAGTRFPWVEGAQDPTAKNYNVYHWMSADIKVRRSSLPGLPTLSAQADYLDYSTNIGDYIDSTTHIETADVSGSDRLFIEVHNRGLTALPGSQVRVLLLLADASAGLPPLPPNYAAHINSGDTSSAWLGTDWRFADTALPYRTLPGKLDVRTPQIVEYDIDFSTLGLPGTVDHVCAAAFISTITAVDQLTASIGSLDQLTMQDKHVAHRNLHLVALGSEPAPPRAEFKYLHSPGTFLLDFHNATENVTECDLVFDRSQFPGHMSVMVSPISFVGGRERAIGFAIMHHSKLRQEVAHHLGLWLERIGELVEEAGESVERTGAELASEMVPAKVRRARLRKLASMDTSRVFVAESSRTPSILGVEIPPRRAVTAAITIRAPEEAKPGDRFRLDIIQRSGERIVGGSSYVIAVTKSAAVAEVEDLEPEEPERLAAGLPNMS